MSALCLLTPEDATNNSHMIRTAASADADYRSMTMAMPCPPPMQRVAKPL